MDLITTLVILVSSILAPVGVVIERPVVTDAVLLRGTVVTMDDAFSVVPDGHVLVVDGRIAGVWSGETPPSGVAQAGAAVVDAGPDALIFPGLINLHDHPSYAAMPVFPPPRLHLQPDAGRPLGIEPYANRYQWNTEPVAPEYDRIVRSPERIISEPSMLGLYTEAVKYAEVESLLGGETAVQGASPNPASDLILARNVDNGSFGRDRVETRVSSVNDPGFAGTEANALKTRMQLGLVDAWIVHLAEGVRDPQRQPGDDVSSRAEFDRIRQLGLLNDTTVVVHGTGLKRADFAAMRTAPPARLVAGGDGLGAKLVWSPLSNMVLYGSTAQVTDALAEGVTVALGTDWSPTGSGNLLTELKVADTLLHHPDHPAGDPAQAGFDDVALDRKLVAMVTRDAARAVGWNAEVGTIAPGTVADLMVLRPPPDSPTGNAVASPYRALIDATERDVQLVMVGGVALAGDAGLMQQLKPGDHELVPSARGGFTKAVDVTDPAVPRGQERLDEISETLRTALAALGGDTPAPGPALPTRKWSYLKERVEGGAWRGATDEAFANGFLLPTFGASGLVNLESLDLNPLLSHDEQFLFDVLEVASPSDRPFDLRPQRDGAALQGRVELPRLRRPGGEARAPVALDAADVRLAARDALADVPLGELVAAGGAGHLDVLGDLDVVAAQVVFDEADEQLARLLGRPLLEVNVDVREASAALDLAHAARAAPRGLELGAVFPQAHAPEVLADDEPRDERGVDVIDRAGEVVVERDRVGQRVVRPALGRAEQRREDEQSLMAEADAVLDEELDDALQHYALLRARQAALLTHAGQRHVGRGRLLLFERGHAPRVVARREDERPGVALDLLDAQHEHALARGEARVSDDALRRQLLGHGRHRRRVERFGLASRTAFSNSSAKRTTSPASLRPSISSRMRWNNSGRLVFARESQSSAPAISSRSSSMPRPFFALVST